MISNVLLIAMLFLFILCCIVIGYLPCILLYIIYIIAKWLIRKKVLGENQEHRQKVYITIVAIVCVCTAVIINPLWYNYVSAKPSDTYVKMKEIDDNQSLIGLSKKQVVSLLGAPYGNKDTNIYYYDAGKITNYLTGGTNDFYHLEIVFDENGTVTSTSIKMEV